MAPMERNLANADGTVTESTPAHYQARAWGGVGWIDVESTFVDQRGRTLQFGIHDDSHVPGLEEYVDRVHAHRPRIGLELHHAGRQTECELTGSRRARSTRWSRSTARRRVARPSPGSM